MARILIVEEDEDVRGILELGLIRGGHRCVVARDTREGLLHLIQSEEPFDAILVEQLEGDGPSPALLRAVAAALFGSVHLLVMTSAGTPDHEPMRSAPISGRVTMIGKPFLLSHVQDLLARESDAGERSPSKLARG